MAMQKSNFYEVYRVKSVVIIIIQDGRYRGTVLMRSIPEIEEQRNQIINKQ